MILAALAVLCAVELARSAGAGDVGNTTAGAGLGFDVPPQSVFIDPSSFAVLGASGPFRNDSQLFNPSGTTPPFFQIFSQEFLDVLGPTPSLRLVAENTTFAFAHEAPVWIPATNEVFFASNDGGALGMSDLEHNSQVSKINLTQVEALAPGALVNYTKVPLSDAVQMTNGGTPHRGELMLVTSGRGNLPPSVVRVHPAPPYNVTVLLDNFFGRQFNSLNDVKVHPTSGKIFFTDVTYGFLNHFRFAPQLPNHVYRLDPDTGALRVVADGFVRPNGIAFSGDGMTAFVTDTGESGGFLGNNQTEPSTIYAFDVNPRTQAFTNRRVFAYADNGVPDGIQVDAAGRVYAGCGDGVQVWSSTGELIGKLFLGTTSANMVFAGTGRLVVLAETAIYVAQIAAIGLPLQDF
ncbi:hypothetical protein M0805_003324 [Coniferiporia weirii]|nr:hypothetical protein M0805_003324 [Coniferiporia weirii]